MEDPLFRDHLKCRWLFLRGNVLSNASFDQYIDSIAGLLNKSQQRNFTVWPILGVYVWPNPQPIPATYAEEITSLKSWVHQRLGWLDFSLPGTCETVNVTETSLNAEELKLFPVPCKDELNIRYSLSGKAMLHWELTDQVGRIVNRQTGTLQATGVFQDRINTSLLLPGVYFLKLSVDEFSLQRRVVKL